MKHSTLAAGSLLVALLVLLVGCADREAPQDVAAPEIMPETMAPQAVGDTLRAVLTGAEMVPGPGDPDGSGTAVVVLNPQDGTVCFELDVENIAEPTASHIHTGAAGESGPPIVNFAIGDVGMSGCVDASSEVISNIQASPASYYVNVHNEEYGPGAIRGQLMR